MGSVHTENWSIAMNQDKLKYIWPMLWCYLYFSFTQIKKENVFLPNGVKNNNLVYFPVFLFLFSIYLCYPTDSVRF